MSTFDFKTAPLVSSGLSTSTIVFGAQTGQTESTPDPITLPAVSGYLATLTEELTNKTLTSSVGKGTWTASGTWTLPAFTLGGTVSGGGQQLNNIIIGTSTPLAGTFTTLAATSVNAAGLALLGSASSLGGVWFGAGVASPTTANYSMLWDGSSTIINTVTSGVVKFRINNVDAGSIGLSGLTAAAATITQGTITDPAPQINGTVTWNDAADTFTGWKLNVTNTNSAAASLLMDLQVGGVSQFQVSPGGFARPLNGVQSQGANINFYDTNGNFLANFNASYQGFLTAIGLGAAPSSSDVFLYRDAAATLALRNSTTAQTFRVYGTYTDASNYSRSALTMNSNDLEISTRAAGTGTVGKIKIDSGSNIISFASSGSNIWHIWSNGNILAENDNANDIGASGANRPRNIWAGGSITGNGVSGVPGTAASPSEVRFGNGAFLASVSQGGFYTGADGVIVVANAAVAGGTFAHTPTTPSQIGANQDDYNPGGVSFFQRWSSDASRNVTGLTFTPTKQSGQRHLIVNAGAQDIVLKHNTTSTAANRFQNTTGADITLTTGQQALLIYDGTSSGNFPAWRVSKMN